MKSVKLLGVVIPIIMLLLACPDYSFAWSTLPSGNSSLSSNASQSNTMPAGNKIFGKTNYPTTTVNGRLPSVTCADGMYLGTVQGDIKSLSSSNPNVRAAAAFSLGVLQDVSSVGALVTAIGDTDADVRLNAIGAIERIAVVSSREQLSTAVSPLIGALKDADTDVRIVAASALGELGDKRAIPELTSSWSFDSDPAVRANACFSIGQIYSEINNEFTADEKKEAADLYTMILRNGDVTLRQGSAFILGSIRDASATDSLKQALSDDPDSSVKKEALDALVKISGYGTAEILINTAKNDNSINVRLNAIHALGRTKSTSAINPLIDLMRNDPDSQVRRFAVGALGSIGDAAAADALIGVLKSPTETAREVRADAAVALGMLKLSDDTIVRQVLTEVLNNETEDAGVRRMASWGLEGLDK